MLCNNEIECRFGERESCPNYGENREKVDRILKREFGNALDPVRNRCAKRAVLILSEAGGIHPCENGIGIDEYIENQKILKKDITN